MSSASELKFEHDFLESLQYKTPFFLFSKAKILNNFQKFKELFSGASIHYAMKANSELEVLQVLIDAGASFEVASKFELDILKDLKVAPDRIIYGTSVKPANHIKDFFEYGVNRYAFDSLTELEKIAAAAPGSKVYVRVAVNDTGSVFRFSEKFGTDIENVIPLLQRAKDLGLKPYGISFHVGSQASNPMAWANAIKSLREPIEHLQELGIEIEALDIGGGYPCNYPSMEEEMTLEEIAKNTLEEYEKLPYKPHLILEPGRGIIASTAVLIATIIAKVDRKDHNWLFLDAGVYNALYESMAFQGSTRYHVTSMRHLYNSGEGLFALAGPTGDSADVITREAHLPQDVEVGDKLIFHDVGAYSLSTSCQFNGFPKPDSYIV